MKKIRYVNYGRVSSIRQKQEDTIEMQKRALHEYAKLHQLTIVGEYYDEAQSGTLPMEERPEGRRLLEDAKKGLFDAVLFYRTDRLGRSTFEGLRIAKTLEQLNIGIRSITENYDTTNPNSKLYFTMLLALAENELQSIKMRLNDGKQRKYHDGKYLVAKAPWGFVKKNQCLVLDTSTLPGTTYTPAGVVQLIFQKTAYEDYGQVRLAVYLDSLGIPAPNQQHWTYGSINRILKNPKYKGEMIVNGLSKYYEPFTISVPPIVSPQLYEDAQKAMKKRKSQHKRTGKTYLLGYGLLRCGYCGQAYSGFTRSHNQTPAYRCAGSVSRAEYYENRKRCTKSSVIDAAYIEGLVWNHAVHLLTHKDSLQKELRKQLQTHSPNALKKGKEKELQALQKRQNDLKSERKRLVSNLIKQRLTENEFDELAESIKQETERVAQKIQEYQKQTIDVIDIEATIQKAMVFYEALAQELEHPLTFERKYKVLHNMFEKIEVYTSRKSVKTSMYNKINDFIVLKNTLQPHHIDAATRHLVRRQRV